VHCSTGRQQNVDDDYCACPTRLELETKATTSVDCRQLLNDRPTTTGSVLAVLETDSLSNGTITANDAQQ